MPTERVRGFFGARFTFALARRWPFEQGIVSIAFAILSSTVIAFSLPEEALLNSDILYGPALIGDLFRGTPIGLWSLTPAPYFFPDLAVYAAAEGVSRVMVAPPLSIAAALRLTAALLFLLDAMAFAFLLWRSARIPLQHALVEYCAFILIGLHLPGIAGGILDAFVPTNHSGLISGVFLFWGLWNTGEFSSSSDLSGASITAAPGGEALEGRGASKRPGRSSGLALRFLGLILIVVAWGVSDAQFLSLTVLPALFIGGWRRVRFSHRRREWPDLIRPSMVILAALAIGMLLVARAFPRIRYGLAYFPALDMSAVVRGLFQAGLPALFQAVLRQDSVLQHGIMVVLLAFVFALDPMKRMAGRLIRQFPSGETELRGTGTHLVVQAAQASMTGLLAVLAFHASVEIRSAVATGVDVNHIPALPFALRYLNFLFAFFYPIVFAVIAHHFLRFRMPAFRRASGVALVLLLLLGWMQIESPSERPLALREAHCIEQALVAWNETVPVAQRLRAPFYGVSDYWHAKRLFLFSNGKVLPLAVHPTSPEHLFFWIVNLGWYMQADHPSYRFAILNGLDEKAFMARYGEPLDRRLCEGLDIRWYGPNSRIDHPVARMRSLAVTVGLPGAREH